jgi:hypothetical protein
VFVIVAVNAKQFPVAAVGRIMVVVEILVVNGEFLDSLASEFAAASCADVREQLQRPQAVICLSFFDIPFQFIVQLFLSLGIHDGFQRLTP